MKRIHLTDEDANTIINRDEDHYFERKALQADGKQLQKVAVAFANTDGGDVVIGIADGRNEADPAKRWVGARRIEDLNSALQALSEIEPSLSFDYTILSTDRYPGFVLQAEVQKSSEVHHTADRQVYLHLGAQCLPVRGSQRIQELAFAKGASSFEDQVLKEVAPEEIVDSKEITTFLHGYSPKTAPIDSLLTKISWSGQPGSLACAAFYCLHLIHQQSCRANAL